MRSSLLAISLALSSMAPLAAQEQPATTTKQGAGNDAPERLKITIRVIPSMVKFDTTHFEVNAGSAVELRFENGCIMPHNLVLIQPSAENALIAGVNALGAEGMQKHFVPDVPGILASSRLLQPQGSEMLSFTAPEEPGKYPFLCTFPGHWFTMRGVMQVRPRGERLQAAQRETEKTATVPDALQTAGISHRPQGTLDKPLLMRTFLPDPGLDPAVFAHHGVGIPGFKYDPATRSDLSQKKQDPSTGKTEEIPQRVPTQPGIPGAIAVNHGESFSYAWDTTECRLLYAWRGGFLDMDPYWGREPGGGRASLYIPKLLGNLVYRASGAAPFEDSAGGSPRFGGYRMVGNAPEFWYTAGSRTIREQVVPGAQGRFELRIQVEGGVLESPWKAGGLDQGVVEVHPEGPGKWRVQFRDRPEAAPAPSGTQTPQN